MRARSNAAIVDTPTVSKRTSCVYITPTHNGDECVTVASIIMCTLHFQAMLAQLLPLWHHSSGSSQESSQALLRSPPGKKSFSVTM